MPIIFCPSSPPQGDSDEEEEDEPALGGDRDEAVPASRWFRADTGAKVRDEEDEEGFMVAGRKGKAKGKKEKEKAAPAPAKVLIPEAAPATPAAADTAPTPLPTAPAALPEAEQKPIVWTDDLFDKKLAEIAANRGKKACPRAHTAPCQRMRRHAAREFDSTS